jgi:hypothetical protein
MADLPDLEPPAMKVVSWVGRKEMLVRTVGREG